MLKPELLLSAGTVEFFFAAMEGGADAIYLGLQDFNAQKRAENFSMEKIDQALYPSILPRSCFIQGCRLRFIIQQENSKMI
ncbi:MAG TPA: hypothetical protein DDX98_01855 [Bacteroidales bacterium]|jgi:putative protease|nr:hypothetical protein [Bacteroidales bacterium]